MPPRHLPGLESLDASAFNAATWMLFAAAVMDEGDVDTAIQFGHDRSLQQTPPSLAMLRSSRSTHSWQWTATTNKNRMFSLFHHNHCTRQAAIVG